MRIISQELLTLLFNSLWQIALIAGVATLCARLLRAARAGTRHLLWVAALIAPVCLAVATIWIGARQGLFTFHPATTIDLTQIDLVNGLPINFSTDGMPPLPAPAKTIPVGQSVALALLAGYGLLFAYRSVQLLRAWLKTRAIVRNASEAELPARIEEIINRCLETIGIANVRVLWSPSIAVPVTIGAIRPVVILPEKMLDEKDADLLTTALGHELAHVRRRDYALNLLYELLYVPISFHPAAAWVKRRIRQTREQRCDELVTEKLLNAGAYARSLVKMAGWATPIVYSTPTISVGVADAGNLEERVMSILRKPRISARKKGLSIAAASLLFAIPCIAAAPHILRVSVKAPDAASAPPRVTAPKANFAPVTVFTPQQEGDRQSEPARNSQESQEYPRCIYCPRPEYSAEAREQKIQGEVWLEVTVKTDGKAYDIKVTKSLNPALDKSAVEAVKGWQFRPAMKDGKQIDKRTTIQVEFLLDPGAGDEAREKRKLAMQADGERGYAMQATLEAQEAEQKARRDQEDQASLLDQDAKLRALVQQIKELERSKEEAAAANNIEAVQRAEEELAQIQNMLDNLKREEEVLKVKEGKDKDKWKTEMEGQNQPGKFEYHGPDGQRQIAEFKQVQTELAARVKIPMSQAIETATKEHPGTVVNCELRGGVDNVFYAITIVYGDEQHRQGRTVLVSAIDGKVLAGRGK
ncbi:MAG TPA: TonB family protein [Candidatus Acidoferrum sp.]|nr:TonB family protein [Candidatus Acidoferrum sp.]